LFPQGPAFNRASYFDLGRDSLETVHLNQIDRRVSTPRAYLLFSLYEVLKKVPSRIAASPPDASLILQNSRIRLAGTPIAFASALAVSPKVSKIPR
jgi:hypothetical protein